MKDSTSTPDWDALLKHSGWVRALARSLVTDAAVADDIEQQVWLRAAEKPPRHAGNLRAWLATLVRSSAGRHWRREKPMSGLAEELQGGGASESVVERMDTVRCLAAAVAGLPEPYASAIYLRYFEELSVREVAARQGVPLNTAQTRLARGLDKLRLKLQGSLGADWRNQCLVFTAPLAAAPSAVLGTTTAIVMTAKTKFLLTAALLMIVSLGVLQPWDQPGDSSSTGTDATSDALASTSATDDSAEIVVERSVLLNPNGGSFTSNLLAHSEQQLIIRVVDGITLEPVFNAEIWFFDHATDSSNRRGGGEFNEYINAKSHVESRIDEFGVFLAADQQGEIRLLLPDTSFEIAARGAGTFGWHRGWSKDQQGNVELELPVFRVQKVVVRVLFQNGDPAVGIPVGYAPASKDRAFNAAQLTVTGSDGRAVFEHLELDSVRGGEEGLSTLAVAVPALQPLFKEFPLMSPPSEEVLFYLPPMGSLEVACKDSNGVPFEDRSVISIQATLIERPGQVSLAQGRHSVAVQDGIAHFENVGVGTNLTIAYQSPRWAPTEYIEAQGPTVAGEEVKVDLVVPALHPPLVLKLVDRENVPTSSRFAYVAQRHVEVQGESTNEIGWYSIDDDGLLEVRVDWALQAEFDSIDFGIISSDGPSVGEARFAIFHHDLSDTSVGTHDKPLSVQYGSELFVAGRCLDTQGQPIPGMELKLYLFDRVNSTKSNSHGFPIPTVFTDVNGYFRFSGTLEAELYRAELGVANDRDFMHRRKSSAISFEVGQDDLVIVRTGQTELRGRVLVDDPAFLSLLRLQVLTEGPDGISTEYSWAQIEKQNGRFRKQGALRERQTLVARDVSSREEFARWENPPITSHPEDGSISVVDLDMRGLLWQHRLTIVNEEGEVIKKPSLLFRVGDQTHTISEFRNQSFLSLQDELEVTVSAPGYRKTTVTSMGEVEVVLQRGIEVHIALPENIELAEDRTWSVRLWKLRDGRTAGVWGEVSKQVTVAGQGITLVVDEPGEWGMIFVQGMRIKTSDGWWTKDYWYPFSPQHDFVPIIIEDTDAYQSFDLPISADGIASMIE